MDPNMVIVWKPQQFVRTHLDFKITPKIVGVSDPIHLSMSFFRKVADGFWSPSFWLPPNSKWEDFESNDERRFPAPKDLADAVALIPFILALKYFLEKFVFTQIAPWAGIKDVASQKPQPVALLEKTYKLNPSKRWGKEDIIKLSKQLDWSERQVYEWYRLKSFSEKPPLVSRFCESLWRFGIFSCIFTFGIITHWNESWIWDIKFCWENFPQPINQWNYWYFYISLSNYSSWCFSHFTDVKRKDSGIMLFHHFVTVMLLITSWLSFYSRIGIVILLIHDVCDFLMEGTKLFKYLGMKIACQIMFLLFTISWVITRLGYFPYSIYSFVFDALLLIYKQSFSKSTHESCDLWFSRITVAHAFVAGALSLLALHIYWTVLIFKIHYTFLTTGKIKDDVCSSDEDDGDND